MKRLLADTHVLLWWLADDERLSGTARTLISEPANDVLVSAASLWEIAIKRRLGKLEAPGELPAIVVEEGFEMLAVSAEHAWATQDLPLHHSDPFDRLLIAQAAVEQLPVLTVDPHFSAYDVVTVVW